MNELEAKILALGDDETVFAVSADGEADTLICTVAELQAYCERARRWRECCEHYAAEECWQMSSGHPGLFDLYGPMQNGYDIAQEALADKIV